MPRLIVVIGPTGVGKTAHAIEIALKHACPIISADSRQIYRDLPIGTAAPTPFERQLVPHYLVAFKELHNFLITEASDTKFCMAGFQLKNTLSDNGTVTRSVCEEEDGLLTNIVETHNIEKLDGRAAVRTETDITYYDDETPVSMNMWGFMPSFLDEVEARFVNFLSTTLVENPLKGEYFLPTPVSQLIEEGKATVKVLTSADRWYGVTYAADKPVVMAALKDMQQQGLYPDGLWG